MNKDRINALNESVYAENEGDDTQKQIHVIVFYQHKRVDMKKQQESGRGEHNDIDQDAECDVSRLSAGKKRETAHQDHQRRMQNAQDQKRRQIPVNLFALLSVDEEKDRNRDAVPE